MSAPSNTPSTPGPDLKFGLWAAPESPLNIEYSLVVIEEIRHEVAEGFQRLSRGGIEVGGVLYGTQEGNTVRILAMRPIACEHARGPGFVLSDKDRMNLHEQLVRDKDDPHLAGLESVGWFLSHTRSEILLNESDLEIYSIFFPAPPQVTMVVRPGRNGAMRAGFFVRDNEGAVTSDHSFLEFNFPDRLQAFLERAAERRERSERRGPSLRRADPVEPLVRERFERREMPVREVVPHPDEASPVLPPFPAPQLVAAKPTRRKWLWLVGWALLLVITALLGLRWWMETSAPEPISLSVLEHDGQLLISWNPSARPLIDAVSGSLEIIDGSQSQTVQLRPQELATGKFTYLRKTGDVEVRMTVQNASGAKTQEASRYLGRPPETPQGSQELADLQKRRAQLEAEVQRLRQENNSQAARIQQLERLLRVLQSRLGIDSGKQ
jgi:proteasome lid subunit RPN8/RPN11